MYRHGMDHVLLELCFTKEFPYSPPSLRIVSPALSDPTHELLKWDGAVKSDRLASGWSSYTSVESLLVQLEVLICKLGVVLKKS
jgi:ubiquitin-protein ligase